MSQSILVTGAAGFIGFHTSLQILKSGGSVVGIDNLNDYYDVQLKMDRLSILETYDRFTFFKLDIADKASMEDLWQRQGPFTKVIHLAAQAGVRYSISNPYDYVTSNLMGHLTVMEMCRHTPDFEHLVYASSSSVYGNNVKTPYSIEDNVDHPVSLYAATKKSDELMSYSYSHLYNIPQTGLRFFTVYGPWGRPDMAYFIFTKAIDEERPLSVFNNGDMKRDFTYVDDVVDGILKALNCPPNTNEGTAPHRVLNIGNNQSEPLMRFINVIEKALSKEAKLDFLPMQAGDVKETYADIKDAAATIGYCPTTTIDAGIISFVKWYKDYYREA